MSKSCAKSCALPRSVFPLKFKVKSPVHALQLARTLIRPFRHWTTGSFAVTGLAETASGFDIHPKSARAEAFCVLGALRRVNTRHEYAAQKFLETAAALQLDLDPKEGTSEDDIFNVNDEVHSKENHRRVLKMLTKAIQLAKAAAAK